MAFEISMQEIFGMILLVVLLLVPSGAAIGYLSADNAQVKLLGYELKNSLNLADKNNLKIEYTLDEKVRISKENTLLKIEKEDSKDEQKTYAKDITISQEKNKIIIIS